MWAERLGSYSMLATLAGIFSLSRLKSMTRKRRLCPPPRCQAVTRPVLLRPPDFFRGSTRALAGLGRGDFGKGTVGLKPPPGRCWIYFSNAHRCPLSDHTPSKNSTRCPGLMVTMAFFQSGRLVKKRPTRFFFPLIVMVVTSRTSTLNICSTACLISILFAR